LFKQNVGLSLIPPLPPFVAKRRIGYKISGPAIYNLVSEVE